MARYFYRRRAIGGQEALELRLALFMVALLTIALLPAFVAAEKPKGDQVERREYDAHGVLVWEHGRSGKDPSLGFSRHYFVRPGGGGGGGAMTDCTSTAYRAAPWHWTSAYSASASQHADLFEQAAATWDAATSASISGGITPGSGGAAGVQDFVNQIDFVDLGATSTIAVTTTWYYTSTGVAVESDGQYNTYYSWATDGRAGAMDVLNIAVHEVGHTFGLDHPKGQPGKIGCLSMYAYASAGETTKRTLGDGDILGIRAKYGA